jgi:hypothetical protein
MPDVKLTLTADEKQTLAALRATDQGVSQLASTANSAGKAFDMLFAKMSKALNVHGNAGTAKIARDLMSKLAPSQTVLAAAAGIAPAQITAAQGGLRAYADKLRAQILGDVKKMAAVTASEQKFYGGMTPDAGKAERRKLTQFIKAQDLGDVDGDVNRFVGRVVKQMLTGAKQRIIQSAQEVGGSHDLLQLARAQGVETTKPQLVRQWIADREHRAVTAGNMQMEMRVSADNQMAAEEARRAQQAAERARIIRAFEEDDLAKRKAGHDGARHRQQTLRGRAGFVGSDEGPGPPSGGPPEGPNGRFSGVRRRERGTSGRGGDDGGGGGPPEPPDDLIGAGMDVVRSRREEERLIRSSRMKRRSDLLGKRSAAQWSAAGRFASGIAGVGVGAIYAGENILGNYNERMGTQYFGALASIEPMFREVMGLGGNAGQQKQLRQMITNAGVANGRSVAETASFVYDIQSAAGNLGDDKQKQIIKAALRFQSVAGGELPIIGQAMTTMENLYGPQIGSVDRMASIIKKTVDYGKFSPTGFAKLSPEAFSAAKMNGLSMEEAAAMMAVVSNTSGRDENMFTGVRYAAQNMYKAEDAGLVTRGGDLVTHLRELKKVSVTRRREIFGMEGINVVSNAIDKVDEIEKLIGSLRGVTGGELSKQELELQKDPANYMSRFAQQANISGESIMMSVLGAGDPRAMNLAGASIKAKLAEKGQDLLPPGLLAMTDFTKNIDRWLHRDEYAEAPFAAIQEGLQKQGGAAAYRQIQKNLLTMNKVKIARDHPGWWDRGFGAEDGDVMSGGAEAVAFDAWADANGAPAATAQDYGDYLFAGTPDGGGAMAQKAVIERARKRKIPGTYQTIDERMRMGAFKIGVTGIRSGLDVMRGGGSIAIGQAVKEHFMSVRDRSALSDAQNTGILDNAVKKSEASLASAEASGDVYGADAARSRIQQIKVARYARENDWDRETATDRRELVSELGLGAGKGGVTTLDATIIKLDTVLTAFVNALSGKKDSGAGGTVPATQPVPAPGSNPTVNPTSSVDR